MPFLTETFTVRSDGPTFWRLVKALNYLGRFEAFCIPAGFRTDFASVPWICTWLIPRYGVYTRAALLHDYLCALVRAGRFKQADADGIFRRVLRELGVSFPRRWMMWAAVRAGSYMTGATRKDWAQFLLVAAIAIPVLLIPMVIVQLWAWLFRLVEWLGRVRFGREVNPGPG